MFDRYTVLVLLQILLCTCAVTQQQKKQNKNGIKPKCRKSMQLFGIYSRRYQYIPHAFLDLGKCHTPSHWQMS